MLLAAAKQIGWLDPERGRFIAIDGDSLRKDGAEYRLMAIDAPELNQRCAKASGKLYNCGRDAKEALRRLTFGRALACRVTDRDRYGREVAECFDGSLNINAEMVRLGWAVAYRRHGVFFVPQENEARAARRGLWQGHFDAPEDWRAQQRNNLMRGSLGPETPPD
jgi:endonuclease YncB( thermonuclease family)